MSPSILAIDPGTDKSGVVLYSQTGARPIVLAEVMDNWHLLAQLRAGAFGHSSFAIEQICSYGMAVGKSTFSTVEWSGRFIEAWVSSAWSTDPTVGSPTGFEIKVLRLPRLEIKVHLCGTAKAKDANIRQALIDRLGEPGNKKNPGPTFGVTSHMWSALAVAVVAADKIEGKERGQA